MCMLKPIPLELYKLNIVSIEDLEEYKKITIKALEEKEEYETIKIVETLFEQQIMIKEITDDFPDYIGV